MGLFSSLNKGKRFVFEMEESLPKENYIKLSEIPDGKTLVVRTIYMNRKSKYGDHYVVLAADHETGKIFGVNLPKFNNETIVGILNNDEMVEAINNEKCGITKGDTVHGENGDYIPTVWVDLD